MHAKMFLERKKSNMQEMRPSAKTHQHFESGEISTLQGFVSIKDLAVDQQTSGVPMQKSIFAERLQSGIIAQESSDRTTLQNSVHQRKDHQYSHFNETPEKFRMDAEVAAVTALKQDIVYHDSINATLSPAHLPTKLSNIDSQSPQKLQELKFTAEIIPRDTSTPHSPQQLSNEEKLRTAQFRSFESFEEVGLQHLQLEIARRDDLLLKNLKQQIDEDHFAMYDLMQGIQSGMVKLDPCSMNKAII